MQRELMSKTDLESAILTGARQRPGCTSISSAEIVEAADTDTGANWELGVCVYGDVAAEIARKALNGCADQLARVYDMKGPWLVEVHTPNVGKGSLERYFENLTGRKAISVMEANLSKALVLRQRGDAPRSDHEALTEFQRRTGKSIQWM